MHQQMNWPHAWVAYLIEFHVTRDYFECHEILEEYWKERTAAGKSEGYWVAWIQLAVGSYHARRQNWNGALKMLAQAQLRFAKEQESIKLLGVDYQRLSLSIIGMIEAIQDPNPQFVEMDIPLEDEHLMQIVFANGPSITSAQTEPELWEKHRLRDRSDVLAARQQALETRRK